MTRSSWSVPETVIVQTIRNRLDELGSESETDSKSESTSNSEFDTKPQPILATIVDVEGSAYRRPGAKMLIEETGVGIGAITAGCLEDELVRAAATVRETGDPELVTYDLMEDDDDIWGLGVGCNGIIEVLLEPLSPSYRPVIEAFEAGRDIAVCTVLTDGDSMGRGDRLFYHPDEERFRTSDGSSPPPQWPTDPLTEPATTLSGKGKGDVLEVECKEDGQRYEVFIDGVAAPAELLILGTGHDVGPLTELGVKNDFRVTVVSFRGGVDVADRFPEADRTVTTSPATLIEDVRITDRTYAVIMTHNFIDDQLALESLLESPAPYIGLMGPHERFGQMLEAFEDDGWRPTEAELKRVYTPIGLDLGGGSPYQIAHSIVAEMMVVDTDRQPGHLRDRKGHIHERVELEASQ